MQRRRAFEVDPLRGPSAFSTLAASVGDAVLVLALTLAALLLSTRRAHERPHGLTFLGRQEAANPFPRRFAMPFSTTSSVCMSA
jgi:hypothetical protein